MSWLPLEYIEQLSVLQNDSYEKPIVILKHSTRCSISVMALGRLDRSIFPTTATFYLLDLLKNRDISNELANKFEVVHESPQILVIKNGECIYDESHMGITMQAIEEVL
jgi:bacillithiol system protein YtxJ